MGARIDHAVAAAWGFAEATAFFVVPDVWLSRVALRHPRRAMATTVSALGGALAGGIATYAWARRRPPADSMAALTRLPSINEQMVREAEQAMTEHGNLAVLVGPTKGVPYKIFARNTAVFELPLRPFLAWSVPARMGRFAAVPLLSAGLVRLGARLFPQQIAWLAPTGHAVFWVAFYSWYFRTVGVDR